MKFKIYIEIKKFYLTNNVIVYSVLGLIFLLGYINQAFFSDGTVNYWNKFVTNWFVLLIIILAVLSPIFLKLYFNYNTYKPLKGELRGYLELQLDKIIVDQKEYFLDEIKEIDIWNFDFKGEVDDIVARGNFNGVMSNGVENLFEVTLQDSTNLKIHYQQDYGNQIIHARKELFNYHSKGKISFEKLARVFGCKDQIDKDIFAKTLTANSL